MGKSSYKPCYIALFIPLLSPRDVCSFRDHLLSDDAQKSIREMALG
jgi:hypothetical protein